MPVGLSAAIFIVVITITLIIVTNKKISKIIRIAAGILGGIIVFLSAAYVLLTLIFFGAID
jgi:hypothetical protein